MLACFSFCVATCMVFGFFNICLAIRAMSPSKVAENNSVWRSAVSCSQMRSTSGKKPMSNMRSASSNTNICKRDKSMRPRSMWSNKRPGVATKMSKGCDSNLFCNGYGMPPTMLTVRARMNLPYLRAASFTCVANSRVGTKTKIRGPRLFNSCGVANKFRAGNIKAAVLPVPVCAEAIKS